MKFWKLNEAVIIGQATAPKGVESEEVTEAEFVALNQAAAKEQSDYLVEVKTDLDKKHAERVTVLQGAGFDDAVVAAITGKPVVRQNPNAVK